MCDGDPDGVDHCANGADESSCLAISATGVSHSIAFQIFFTGPLMSIFWLEPRTSLAQVVDGSEIVTASKNFRVRENGIFFDASRLKASVDSYCQQSGRNEVGCKKCISATLQEKGVAV